VVFALSAVVAPCQIVRHEQVVVTGTADPIPLEEIDRSVTVLPMDNGQIPADSVTDLLRLTPAVDLEARAPGGIQTDVSIRGGSFGQTLVLLNGERLNDPQTGHHSMDIPVPPEAIDRVEILRGSGSTLYGSDAVGGVINVITRRPEASEMRFTAGVGNFGSNFERVSAGGAEGRFSGQLAAERDYSSGFRPDRDYRNLSLAATGQATTVLGLSSLVFAYSDKPFGADQFYGNFNSWENTKTWFASLQQDLGDQTQASFSFRRHSDLFVLERYDPDFYTNHHVDETWDGAVRRRDPLSANTGLHYGVEGYADSITSSNLGEHERGRGAGYVLFDARALRRFSFSVGLREEIWRRISGQLSPTAAAGVWLSSKWKLRGSAGRAFRAPTYTELYYHDPANLGSPFLKPENAWTYEAGTDWIPRDSVRVSASVFERRVTNGIDYVRDSTSAPWQAVNLSSTRFTGVEGSLEWRPAAGQQVTVGYDALHGIQGALDGLTSKYVFNYPSESAVVAWQGSLWHGVVARARVATINRTARPVYTLIDFYAGYAQGRLRPFVKLTNLGNASYEEISGVVMPGRGIVGGLSVVVR
jgi:iron complex outermembrane recepter protein